MIDFLLVDKKKAVVAAGDDFDLDGRVLGVVFLEIECELPADFLRVDGCGYSGPPLGKHEQDGFIHVIVHEDEGGLRLFDERGGKCVGVEYLAVVENALARRLTAVAFERVEDFLKFLVCQKLLAFDLIQALKNPCVVEDEFAHGHKGPHNLDADFHGTLASQDRREGSDAFLRESVGQVAAELLF